MLWACGLTTVPDRLKSGVTNRTMQSLAAAGFPDLRVFVDDDPKMGVVGRWVTGLWELWVRHPESERFVMFQDDLLAVKNLRGYLESCPWPSPRAYLNLYTYPYLEKLGKKGWFPSQQLGHGALGLVFDREGVLALLSSRSLVRKPLAGDDPHHGAKRSLDGAVQAALCIAAGDCRAYRQVRPGGPREECWTNEPELCFCEYVHVPSLLQHTGMESSMGKSWDSRHLSTTFQEDLALPM